MRKIWIAAALLLGLATGCQRELPATLESEAEPELPTITVTRWSEKTELFLEYPSLAAGRTSRFAIHLTDLATFRPLTTGQATVELRRDGTAGEQFRAESPSRPGIFGVDVVPRQAGTYTMSIRVLSGELEDVHILESVTVSAGSEPAALPEEEAEEGISFLKEQQWTLDFRTEKVAEQSLRESIQVHGEVRPRTGGEAEVVAPFGGRLAATASSPTIGTTVEEGQVLAALIPKTSSPSERAALEFAVAEAEAELSLARKNAQRLGRLLEAGAVPARRLDEARTRVTMLEAKRKAAQARLAQLESWQRADGAPGDNSPFLLRAPISGIVAEAHATVGANVEQGQNLFRIVSLHPVHVFAAVPEANAPQLRSLSGAEIEAPGIETRFSPSRLISVGRIVDPASRTLSVIYEVQNSARLLAVGQAVSLRLFTSKRVQAPAVPESAVVDDGGRPVVFVQTSGESFARRPVRLGVREAGYVHVLEGLEAGERVVTLGAYLIRLAALSTQIPVHGHVH
ncbi:MAG: efflux RND transporter periplasmic adaptor subunit [Acidobacteria bacterium]|nr:efflux RND transporter periplasmic adaptor subunit [Acidobacteriota bacterium]